MVFKDQANGVISQFAAQQAKELTNALVRTYNISNQAVKNRYQYALKGFTAKLTDQQLKALKQDPRIDRIVQDHTFPAPLSIANVVSNTASFVNYNGQLTPWSVSRANGPLDGVGKKAWILGTGIDLNHPDLNVDVLNSVSFIAHESADDINGHGTYVAGILAAKDNGSGIVGVAAEAEVVAIKVLHSDSQHENEYSDVVDGIDYVAGKASPNDIVNLSLGDPTPDK